MVGGLDINGVGPLAQGAVGMKIMLGQHGFQLLGKVMPGREEFQIVAFFRVGHRAAAQKRCGDKRLHTVLASEISRTDAQGRLLAGVAKQCQHPGNLGWVLYAELIHRACGAFLADNSALHTAATVELLGKMATPSFSVCKTTPRSSKYLPKQATAYAAAMLQQGLLILRRSISFFTS